MPKISITKREREVINLIFCGLDGPGIANELCITEWAVKGILHCLRAKANVNKTALVLQKIVEKSPNLYSMANVNKTWTTRSTQNYPKLRDIIRTVANLEDKLETAAKQIDLLKDKVNAQALYLAAYPYLPDKQVSTATEQFEHCASGAETHIQSQV